MQDGSAKAGTYLGSRQPRLEDERLLTGRGRFVDDMCPDQCGHAVFLRAPFASARIAGMDTSDAAGLPGIRGIFGADALEREGIGDIVPIGCIPDQAEVVRPALARDRVRHVGEIVAMVVADTVDQARDAMELIAVEYDTDDAVVDLLAALESGAPQLHDHMPSNLAYDWTLNDPSSAEQALAGADRVVEITVQNNRLVIAPMETRGAVAMFDGASGTYRLHTPTQGVHSIRDTLADHVFRIDRDKIRIVTDDVGGAFGIRLQTYPEHVLVMLAARLTGRPVKWIADRTETFLADAQGRAHVDTVRLGLDAQGKFLALVIDTVADFGAYYSTFAAAIPSLSASRGIGHTYKIPHVNLRVRGVFTNTVPVDSYRGAGKPEMVFALERAIESAALDTRIDPVELRRRNLITPDELPYETPAGQMIDSGDFPAMLDAAMKAADWDGFAARRADAEARGKCAGIALGLHFHATSGFLNEHSRVEVDPSGYVAVKSGMQTGGQGHETVFAQLVADRLGVPIGQVRVVEGDTSALETGGGTGGSSAATVGASNIARASDLLIERGYDLASAALEAARTDIEFSGGGYTIVGTDRRISLFDLAACAPDLAGVPDGVEKNMAVGCDFDGPFATFPNGCYVAEVEVDPETGAVSLVRFTAVDDIGVALNPMLAEGQTHGAIVQGLGQALTERTVYDDETGQLFSGSMMDYCLPRADDVPPLDLRLVSYPTRVNPLGAKGLGELGCIGAPAPVVHAVLNALRPLGVEQIDMPLTPERVWRAIRSGTG